MVHQMPYHRDTTPRIPYALTARLRADMRKMIREEWEKHGGEPGGGGGGGGAPAPQIALDDDGVPFLVTGTGVPGTHYVALDVDGVPYLTTGGV